MAPRALAVAGAVLVVSGFFLPWLNGAAEFAARDFSGFDLARLVRNFEIVASSSPEAGRLGLIAAVLYTVPALAVNGAILSLAPAIHRKAGAIALAVAAVYALVVLTLTAAMTVIPGTDLEGVLGAPMKGFFVSIAGGAALAAAAALTLRRGRR